MDDPYLYAHLFQGEGVARAPDKQRGQVKLRQLPGRSGGGHVHHTIYAFRPGLRELHGGGGGGSGGTGSEGCTNTVDDNIRQNVCSGPSHFASDYRPQSSEHVVERPRFGGLNSENRVPRLSPTTCSLSDMKNSGVEIDFIAALYFNSLLSGFVRQRRRTHAGPRQRRQSERKERHKTDAFATRRATTLLSRLRNERLAMSRDVRRRANYCCDQPSCPRNFRFYRYPSASRVSDDYWLDGLHRLASRGHQNQEAVQPRQNEIEGGAGNRDC